MAQNKRGDFALEQVIEQAIIEQEKQVSVINTEKILT